MAESAIANTVLPEWDLSDLYPGPESPQLRDALAELERQATGFEASFQGKVGALTGDQLGQAVRVFEQIEELAGRIGSYAGLYYVTRLDNAETARFSQGIQERLTDISAHLLFFTLEINRIEDATFDALMASPVLNHYRPWLDEVRLFREHQLSDEAEHLLHDKSVSGRSAWARLFDETIAGLRFQVDGESLTEEQVLGLLSDKDAGLRRKAAEALTEVFGKNIRLFALVMNTLVKDKEVEDRWRKYATPAASRHLANQVEPEVVDALVSAARDAYPRLSHRYYALKARWMGVERLNFWDRNAPLPEHDDAHIPWEQATSTVIEAYRAFSPKLADVAHPFFANNWIDAPVKPGKQGGAFAHPTVPSAHPYLLLNYQGKTRDVTTLAHELGHGVHQVLAGPRGALMAGTPLTLAETASVFGEMLTFQALLAQTTDPVRRKVMLASKVEDMINTVVRQTAFHTFEEKVHAERRTGELTPQRLGEIWMGVQADSLGPAIELTDAYRDYWCYIPHFIHTPFYVYAYAFGDCLVNSLYAVYQQQPEGFEDKYLDMLRAGGTKRHKELLAPFGLDASDPAFWQKGLSMISAMIDELESL
ncbi:M3 family oligoendopeptidase [Emcibacter sp. SYSU 3D8]|uniref:M3 family oligoendopeptidase n=1 Tax=Emcibacter sp. SYSU 3D8 TaxID=3133969 RepID=UPI0031FF38C4